MIIITSSPDRTEPWIPCPPCRSHANSRVAWPGRVLMMQQKLPLPLHSTINNDYPVLLLLLFSTFCLGNDAESTDLLHTVVFSSQPQTHHDTPSISRLLHTQTARSPFPSICIHLTSYPYLLTTRLLSCFSQSDNPTRPVVKVTCSCTSLLLSTSPLPSPLTHQDHPRLFGLACCGSSNLEMLAGIVSSSKFCFEGHWTSKLYRLPGVRTLEVRGSSLWTGPAMHIFSSGSRGLRTTVLDRPCNACSLWDSRGGS
jgi:hypothetical protein